MTFTFSSTDQIAKVRLAPANEVPPIERAKIEAARFTAERNAAVENLIRTPEGEATCCGKNTHIVAATGSSAAMQFFAELFSPTITRSSPAR